MKRIYQILVLAILVILNTSCLKSGLDELETYNLNDITNVRFEYRWWNESEQRMRIIEMNVDKSIDKENKKISCTITVPEATNKSGKTKSDTYQKRKAIFGAKTKSDENNKGDTRNSIAFIITLMMGYTFKSNFTFSSPANNCCVFPILFS